MCIRDSVRIVDVDSEPHQFVDPTLEDPLGYVDLRNESDPDRAAQEWMRADYSAPIDILRDRLIAATVLHLEDCILYTSPSPRDRTRSRMPAFD